MADQAQIDRVMKESTRLFEQNNPGQKLSLEQREAMRTSIEKNLSGDTPVKGPTAREAAAQARPLGGAQPARELTTSERVGSAIDAYKKEHPGETFNAKEVKDLIDGVEATEARIGRKVTAKEIKDLAITAMVDDRNGVQKVIGVAKDAIIPAAYALDGALNAQAGKAAAQIALTQGGKKVAQAMLGPIIGAALTLGDAGIDVYQGHYKQAGISATSGIASIAAAAGTGALMGSVFPGAGTGVGLVVGAVVGAATLLGSKWGLNKIFNDAASNETPAAEPVAIKSFVPQNNKNTAPGFGAVNA